MAPLERRLGRRELYSQRKYNFWIGEFSAFHFHAGPNATEPAFCSPSTKPPKKSLSFGRKAKAQVHKDTDQFETKETPPMA
jgi:hypothetical protein